MSSETTGGMGACCLSGKLQSGTATGTIETVHGLETYIAAPPGGDKSKTVVYITDIFGLFTNAKLLADEIAKAGFYVLMPHLFEGDAMSIDTLEHIEPPLKAIPNRGILDTAKTQGIMATQLGPFAIRNREAVAKPKLDAFIAAVRSDPSVSKIGVVGFCWGGRHAILQAQEGHQVDAAVACHPSMTAAADYETVVKPLSIAYGDHDSLVPMAQVNEFISILEKKTNLDKEIRIYEDQVHGFAVRGDFSSDKDKQAMDDAQKQIIDWFKKYL